MNYLKNIFFPLPSSFSTLVSPISPPPPEKSYYTADLVLITAIYEAQALGIPLETPPPKSKEKTKRQLQRDLKLFNQYAGQLDHETLINAIQTRYQTDLCQNCQKDSLVIQ